MPIRLVDWVNAKFLGRQGWAAPAVVGSPSHTASRFVHQSRFVAFDEDDG